jgi:hypothetical protein
MIKKEIIYMTFSDLNIILSMIKERMMSIGNQNYYIIIEPVFKAAVKEKIQELGLENEILITREKFFRNIENNNDSDYFFFITFSNFSEKKYGQIENFLHDKYITIITEGFNVGNISRKKLRIQKCQFIGYSRKKEFLIFNNKKLFQLFKKHPVWGKTIQKIIENNLAYNLIRELSFVDRIILLKQHIEKNHHYLKEINPLEKKYKTLEQLYDDIHKEIHRKKMAAFLKKEIFSTKTTKVFFSKRVLEEFLLLFNNGFIDKENVISLFKRKIITMKSEKDVYESVLALKKNLLLTGLTKTLNDLNVKFKEQDSYIVARIEDYEIMKKIGSRFWCITQQENYFFRYAGTHNMQWVIWEIKEGLISQYGITTNINNEPIYGFDEMDVPLTNDKLYELKKFIPLFRKEDFLIEKMKQYGQAFNMTTILKVWFFENCDTTKLKTLLKYANQRQIRNFLLFNKDQNMNDIIKKEMPVYAK